VTFFGNVLQHSSQSQSPGSSRAFAVVATLAALAFAASCRAPVGPSSPTTSTTTTVVAPTTTTAATTTTTTGGTTTTTGGTTTTTTTTTTTAGIDYASQIHPQWDKENCTQCHDSGNPLNLSGSPTETCNAIAARDGSNTDLVITGAGADGSLLIRKPALDGVTHAGGALPCFGKGASCFVTTLAWLTAGAPGPGGGTCGG
jgi:hypothetical protein